MDRVENYRNYIRSLLEEHSKYASFQDDVESELFFDTVHDRYQLMRVGWNNLKRVYYTVMHFDLRDGKIWIQQNMADIDVGQKLVDMGVLKDDIILGLHPPYKRPYTGYGVA